MKDSLAMLRRVGGRLALCVAAASSGIAQAPTSRVRSSVPPSSLTGANGGFIHDSWRAASGRFPDVGASALSQDRAGFLLVGTARGVYRFDGREFFGPWTDRMNGAEMLAVDSAGALWVATHNFPGLVRRTPDGNVDEVHVEMKKAHGAGTLAALARSPNGRVYLAQEEGVFARERGEVRWYWKGKIGMPFGVTDAGVIWTATGGLSEIRANTLRARPDLWTRADGPAPTALFLSKAGHLWLAGAAGVMRIDAPDRTGGGTIRRYSRAALGLRGEVTALLEDANGELWIGTAGGGVVHLSLRGAESLTSALGLSDDFVEALYEDRQGDIWVGTRSGLDRLRPRAVRVLTTRDGLGDMDVWSVGVERSGSILVGTRRGGVTRVRDGKGTPLRTAAGRAVDFWNGSFEMRPDGSVLMAQQSPVETWRYTPSGALLPWRPGGKQIDGGAFSFLTDPDGTLWVGGRFALYRVRGDSVTEIHASQPLPQAVWGIVRDRKGSLFVVAGGLYRLTADSLALVCDGAHDMPMSFLVADSAGIWYGNKLSLYRDGTCRTLAGPELPRRDLYAGIVDRQGQFWLMASEGLFRINSGELVRRALDPAAPLHLRLFDRFDGLLSGEFNSYGNSPVAMTHDGLLLFASAGGLAVVDPAHLPQNRTPPVPVIMGVTLNDSSYTPGPRIQAPLGVGTVEFEITTPAPGIPERARLQYRLDGVDSTWQEAGDRRRIAYPLRAGGAYRFRVRAVNEEGIWSAAESTQELSLKAPPFTLPWPVVLLTVLGVAGTILGVGLVRVRVIAARERRLSALVALRTRELEDARDRLEERVAERTAELAQESAERLKAERDLFEAQKMDSVGRLAGGVAHDLNNMLTSVLGGADLLRETLHDESDAAVAEQIFTSGSRAAQLTNQLLSYARRQVGQPELFTLEELVRDVEPMLRSLVTGHITLAVELEPDPWIIWADRGQLEQVLVNLTLNAEQAMPEGGTLRIVSSKVELAEGALGERSGLSAGPHVCLDVQDTGVGIPTEVLQHVFEPFFTTKEQGKGTGLGLASSFGIVKQWGGHIAITSTVGNGTTVSLWFPRRDA